MGSSILKKAFGGRYATLFATFGLFIVISFIVRTALGIWASSYIDYSLFALIRAYVIGFVFDCTAGGAFLLLYAGYLLVLPKRWIGTYFDKGFTYFYLAIILLLFYFSAMAEFPFWDEFGARFNFIAVDYLVYTYEVISNINQSYPLPLIIGALLLLVVGTFTLFSKKKIFSNTFSEKKSFQPRLYNSGFFLVITILLLIFVKNKWAEQSNNQTINEVSKNGILSFFAAYRSNELDYETFYPKINDKEAYCILKKNLLQSNQNYTNNTWDSILRTTKGDSASSPNIILVTIESFSAEFLKAFGNKDNITPFYDSIANNSIFFTNLYATGTRTVRGMEALTLSVPPTPGNSIVRRLNNQHLFSIATILRQRNYHPYFVYGGDGYFDNMNNFFGGQGFDIVDRDRGNPLSDDINTHRYTISDEDVSFENAWGICDEDLYKQVVKYADSSTEKKEPFFQFVMTTSNHKPYTFPNGKINLPQGNRDAAVRYTDYALQKFIETSRKKSWFKNTVFVIVADHCASSAGKWEINIDKHHIPAIIYNLPHKPEKINRLTSQIDLMPSLFGYLGWNYNTALYGKDINQVPIGEERAFVGNYRTLGMLKNNIFTQIDDKKKVKQFTVSDKNKTRTELKHKNQSLINETISYYQTASERFKNGQMKE